MPKKAEKTAHKQEKKDIEQAARQTSKISDMLDIRDYIEHDHQRNGYFVLSDGSLMDIFEIQARSYMYASTEEIESMVYTNTLFLRMYTEDFKFVFLNYPTNTRTQQQYLLQQQEKTDSPSAQQLMEAKLKQLRWLDEHTTCRRSFFFLFAKDIPEYNKHSDLLFQKSAYLPRTVPRDTKEHILWQLNNMNKQMRL